jgi:hypothetical protein
VPAPATPTTSDATTVITSRPIIHPSAALGDAALRGRKGA